MSESKISAINFKILVRQIYMHRNEDKSLDVRFEFNGDFGNSTAMYVDGESA